LKLTITNYPSDKDEMVVSENNPENPLSGEREMPFGKEIFIEKEDFKPEANRKFFRLTIGKEVRLKSAYIIKANELVYDDQNNVVEVLCTYDPKSKSGSGSEESQRKVKGTLHWVSKKGSVDIKVNEYDRLFEHPNPASAESNEELLKMINPNSSKTSIAKAEPFLSNAQKGDRFQFQRKGYFIVDNNETPLIVFNKTVGLRDNWKK
jgi:glutaminyl-tRNA synthetase